MILFYFNSFAVVVAVAVVAVTALPLQTD